MFKSKKAQGIPMETVIIAIIVLVVLVVIIAFFVGGTSTVVQKIKQLFGGATAGTDKQQAVQFCQQYCDQLVQSGQPDKNSPFCTKFFYIDTKGTGSADRVGNDPKKPYFKYYCTDMPGSAGLTKGGDDVDTALIGVTCSVGCQ